MKYIVSILLMCVLAVPAASQRKAWSKSPPQKHQDHKKSDSKGEKCSVKDCKCVCHKKATHKKSNRRDSERGDKRGGRVIRGRSAKGTRSRRSRSTDKTSAEYESKLRARLRAAVDSGKLKKEQADKLLKERFGSSTKKKESKDTNRRGQRQTLPKRININSNDIKQWGEILSRRLQGNRHFANKSK